MKRSLVKLVKKCATLAMGVALVACMFIGNGMEASAASSAGIHGVNWADGRDNYADDNLVLSGLSSSDSYQVVKTKAGIILNGFKTELGANTVRIPVNPYTVSGSWWNSYKGAIDKALEMDMKVILGYWEGPNNKDGKVDNTTAFWDMWSKIVREYGTNGGVYFEIMNEPFGYSQSEWGNLCAQWLSVYSGVPHGRILVGGTGYDDYVTGMGADNRFSDCLLSQHIYPYWNSSLTTESAWRSELNKRIGQYASRTVITEFGTEMDTTYGVFDYGDTSSKDHRIVFMRAVTNYIHDNNMGATAWPGLRTGDSYSIMYLSGSGTNIKMNLNNTTIVPLLKHAFTPNSSGQISEGTYCLVNANSDMALDVNGESKDGGASVIQWHYNGNKNQQWKIVSAGNGYYTLQNVNSGLLLDVNASSKDAGGKVIQWKSNGGANQQWKIIDCGGYYELENRNSGLLLDVNGSSTKAGETVLQWYRNGGENQKWYLMKM